MLNGIDISHYQGNVNFDQLKTDFVIMKVTEGTTYVDPMWITYNKEVIKRGIPHGYYHFVRGGDAVAEVDFWLKKMGGLDPNDVLMIDFEVQIPDAVNYILKMAQTISDRCNGLKPLIYMSESVATGSNWQPLVDLGCGLAVAKYGTNTGNVPSSKPKTGAWPFWAIWQYTSVGKVAGISGNVDLDQFNGTKEQFLKYGYQPGTPTPEPTPPNGGDNVTQAQADEQSLRAGYIQEAGEWPSDAYVDDWRNSGLTPYTYNQQHIQVSVHDGLVDQAVEQATAEANKELEAMEQELAAEKTKNEQLNKDLTECQANKPDGAIIIIINWFKRLFKQSEGGE